MKSFSISLLIVVAFGFVTPPAFARTEPSREQVVSGRLASVVQFYIQNNQEHWPTNWEQLVDGLVEPNKWLGEDGIKPVQALYVFLPTNFPPLEQPKGRIILARYNPIIENGLKGRYIIYQTPDGWCVSHWVSEYDFQTMLSLFGSTNSTDVARTTITGMGSDDRILAENQFAKDLSRSVSLYSVVNGRPPASWTNLLDTLNTEYLFAVQEHFRGFGEQAGFTNSILEKYVFLPKGIVVPANNTGEAVMMSSHSIRWGDGELCRMVVFLRSTNDAGFVRLPEQFIKQMLEAAGIPEPVPEDLPPLNPPLSYSLPKDFEEFEQAYEAAATQGGRAPVAGNSSPQEQNQPPEVQTNSFLAIPLSPKSTPTFKVIFVAMALLAAGAAAVLFLTRASRRS